MTVSTKIRLKNSVLTCKAQVSAGTYNEPSASANAIRCENVTIGINPNLVNTNEYSASLDPNAPLVGGQKYTISFPLYLRGSGVPGTEPEWGVLAKICSLAPTITKTDITSTSFAADSGSGHISCTTSSIGGLTVGTVGYISGFDNPENNGEVLVDTIGSGFLTVTNLDGSAKTLVTETAGASVTFRYGVVGTAAIAGSTTAATLQSPFAAASEIYRFMPAVISGNPAEPFTTFIQDYTAGRVATLTDLFGSALTTSSIVSIPANVAYLPASGDQTWGSFALYSDKVVWKFLDGAGSFKVDWSAAGITKVTVSIDAKFEDTADADVPTPTYDGTKPGVWRGSRFLLNRTPVSLNAFSVDFKTTNLFPENPNDDEGFDAPIIDGRNVTGSINPHMTLRATRNAIKDMRAGVRYALLATLEGAPGGTAGNRVAQMVPAAVLTNAAPGQQQGLWTDNISFFAEGQDAGSAIVIW